MTTTMRRALLLLLALAVALPPAARAQSSAQPLTIHFEKQLSGGLDEKGHQVVDRALAIVGDYFRSTFKVKRPENSNDDGALFLEAPCSRSVQWSGRIEATECLDYRIGDCGNARANESLFKPREVCDGTRPGNCRTEGAGSPGVPGAQYVVYLTSKQDGGCSTGDLVGELASAVYCTRSSSTDNRPTSGNINVCPETLARAMKSDKEFYSFVDTLTHEMFHLVGFNPGLFPDFVDESGRGVGQVVFTTTEGGTVALVSPNVLRRAREHFGCADMTSVPLEPNGGEGTAGGHWSRTLFGDREVMVSTIAIQRSVVSDMTLAVIEDTGWFQVDYDRGLVGDFDFGAGMGCALVDQCQSRPSRFYCTAEDLSKTSLCSPNFYSVGSCSSGDFAGDSACPIVKSFGNMICRQAAAGSLGYDPNEWAQSYGESSRCLPIASDPPSWESGNRFQYTSIELGDSAGCFNVRCDDKRERIFVSVEEGREAECRQGGFIEASELKSTIMKGRIGPCPAPKEFCKNLGCPNDCSTNGDCQDRKCRCYLGFAGEACDGASTGSGRKLNAVGDKTTESEDAQAQAAVPPPASSGADTMAAGSPAETKEGGGTDSGKGSVPWKVIVIGIVCFVGVLSLCLSGFLIYRRYKSPGRRSYRQHTESVESVRAAQQQMTSVSQHPEPGLGSRQASDLDGGVVGVHAHRLLYGNDIRV